MRIILTGATGFLGSHLARALVKSGYRVTAAVRGASDFSRIEDLSLEVKLFDLDDEGVEGLFKGSQHPDAVLHSATRYGRTDETRDEIEDSNFRFPVELARAAARHGVQCFINTDTFFPPDYPHLPAYSLSKRRFLEWSIDNTGERPPLFINMRLQHLYGPGDSGEKFIPFLIRSCLEQKKEIPLTEGIQKRDLIYVGDAVDAYLLILKNISDLAPGYHHFDVGTGISTSIRDLAMLIRKESGSGSTLLFGAVKMQDGELMDSKADIKKLRALGWEPKTSLSEGIRRTVQNIFPEDKGKHV